MTESIFSAQSGVGLTRQENVLDAGGCSWQSAAHQSGHDPVNVGILLRNKVRIQQGSRRLEIVQPPI